MFFPNLPPPHLNYKTLTTQFCLSFLPCWKKQHNFFCHTKIVQKLQPGLLDDDGGILNPFNPKVNKKKKNSFFFCQTKNPTTSMTDFHSTNCLTLIYTKSKITMICFVVQSSEFLEVQHAIAHSTHLILYQSMWGTLYHIYSI